MKYDACPRLLPISLLALAFAAASSGCLSRPPLVKESFALASPAIQGQPAVLGANVLGLKSITVSPLYAGKPLVYRTGEHSFERDPYAEFLVLPAQALLVPVRAHLRNSGLFADVAETGSALKPGRSAEIYVTDLFGDFRPSSPASSVIHFRFLLFGVTNGAVASVEFQKDYARRVPLRQRTAAAVVEGWDKGLEEILGEVVSDLKASARPQ